MDHVAGMVWWLACIAMQARPYDASLLEKNFTPVSPPMLRYSEYCIYKPNQFFVLRTTYAGFNHTYRTVNTSLFSTYLFNCSSRSTYRYLPKQARKNSTEGKVAQLRL